MRERKRGHTHILRRHSNWSSGDMSFSHLGDSMTSSNSRSLSADETSVSIAGVVLGVGLRRSDDIAVGPHTSYRVSACVPVGGEEGIPHVGISPNFIPNASCSCDCRSWRYLASGDISCSWRGSMLCSIAKRASRFNVDGTVDDPAATGTSRYSRDTDRARDLCEAYKKVGTGRE